MCAHAPFVSCVYCGLRKSDCARPPYVSVRARDLRGVTQSQRVSVRSRDCGLRLAGLRAARTPRGGEPQSASAWNQSIHGRAMASADGGAQTVYPFVPGEMWSLLYVRLRDESTYAPSSAPAPRASGAAGGPGRLRRRPGSTRRPRGLPAHAGSACIAQGR